MPWKWVGGRVMLLLSFLVWEFHAEFLGKTLEMQPLMVNIRSWTKTSISVSAQN